MSFGNNELSDDDRTGKLPDDNWAGFKLLRAYRRSSLRVRVTLLFLLLTAALFLVFSESVIWMTSRGLAASFDSSLFNYASEVSESVNLSQFGDWNIGREELLAERKILPFNLGQASLQIVDRAGRIRGRLGSHRIEVKPHQLESFEGRAQSETLSLDGPGRSEFRLITFPIVRTGPPSFLLQIAVPLDQLNRRIQEQKAFIYFLVTPFLVILFLAGYFFSGAMLSPLFTIIRRTEKMTISSLDERLPEENNGRELDLLSKTLNDFFARVESAYRSQEDFIVNASHQLRTPLAIIQGEVDVFQRQPRSETEHRTFHERLAEELSTLNRAVKDLLMLARLESGAQDFSFASVHLDEILFALTQRLNPVAKKRCIAFAVNVSIGSGDFCVRGDAGLLEALFQCLLENALFYSPDHETVTLTLKQEGEFAEVVIENAGVGIPAEFQEKIFERFFRWSPERKSQGTGLGLSIARKIARLHQGDIVLLNGAGPRISFLAKIKKF
ncbi:MAG: hypothetical protein C5B49_03695 [Bdellovibrio sp.]|nr:MAG: hypothetical protein C5B49_03695 [Bdellovibrio sp.]